MLGGAPRRRAALVPLAAPGPLSHTLRWGPCGDDTSRMHALMAQGTSDSGAVVLVLLMAVLAVVVGFTLATLVEVLKVPPESEFQSGNKAIWAFAIVFTGAIGAALYHAAGKPLRAAPTSRPQRAPGQRGQGSPAHAMLVQPNGRFWCESCGFTTKWPDEAQGHENQDRPAGKSAAGRNQSERLPTEANPAPRAVRTSQATTAPLVAVAPTPDFKTCPDCAEEIRFAARKCRFCGYIFEASPAATG